METQVVPARRVAAVMGALHRRRRLSAGPRKSLRGFRLRAGCLGHAALGRALPAAVVKTEGWPDRVWRAEMAGVVGARLQRGDDGHGAVAGGPAYARWAAAGPAPTTRVGQVRPCRHR